MRSLGRLLSLACVLSVAACGGSSDSDVTSASDSDAAGDTTTVADTSSPDTGGDIGATTDVAVDGASDGSTDALDGGADATVDVASDASSDGSSDAADGADTADAGPTCALCQKMNAKPVVFGGSVIRYAVLEPTRVFWTASTSRDDNSTIWSLDKTATLGAPVDHKAYAYTKRNLTYHDGAFYWFDKASDSTYIDVGRLTLATDVSERTVFEKDASGYFKSMEYSGLLSDGTAPLLYSIAGNVYTLPNGTPPGPEGTPAFGVSTGYGISLSFADATSYYGDWDWGGGSYGYSLVRIDRTTHAMTEMVHYIGAPLVLLVYGGEVYYRSYSSVGTQVLHVGKDVTSLTTGSVVSAIPTNALVYPVAPSNLCWAEEGKSDLHCLDVATSVVGDRSTGGITVDAVIGDATNHYFFSRAPGTYAGDWLFDVYRVGK